MTSFFQAFKTLTLAIILSIGISYAYAAWAPPTQAPTGGNAEAPVNVGNATQLKAGGLGVNGLLSAFAGLKVGNSSVACDSNGAGTIKYTGADILGCINNAGTYEWKSLTITGTGGGCASGSLSWTTPGTYTVTVGNEIPSCVTNLKTIEVWGGGGGGAAGSPQYGNTGSGGGGGGYGRVANYAVTAGQIITLRVGAGGAGGIYNGYSGNNDCTAGGNGGNSYFGPFTATGGSGGQRVSFFVGPCTGGSGGSASGTGIIATTGGAGADGVYGHFQGGGSGGSGANGGAGGSGGPYGGSPGVASAPGGGGGGGPNDFDGSSNIPGGSGASGRVKIVW